MSGKVFEHLIQDLAKADLMIGGHPHRIVEMEVYAYNQEHPDMYVHCHPDQQHPGRWYFHRHGNGTYRNGTFKGLDITMGNPETYCGILIRALWYNDTCVVGPSKVVDHILSLLQLNCIMDLTQNELLSIEDPRLNLVLHPHHDDVELYVGPRIGLKPDKCPPFAQALYRYVAVTGMQAPIKAKRSLVRLH